jgi:hypothetical protein
MKLLVRCSIWFNRRAICLQVQSAADPDAQQEIAAEATVRLPMDQLVGALNEHVSADAGHDTQHAALEGMSGRCSVDQALR